MTPGSSPLRSTPTGVRLRLHVQPRASRTEIAGRHGAALKVRIAAPPVDGAANEALVRFLADRLGVSRSAVQLESGAGGRAKVIVVEGIGLEDAGRRLGL
jgi:uncharacterized protein (TIGR00251 family)